MTGSNRIFLALSLPDALKSALASEQAVWKAAVTCRSIRWIPRQNLHITLKFIGDVDDKQTDSIIEECNNIFHDIEPLTTVPDARGVFPSPRRPRILWAGTSKVEDSFFMLKNQVEDALSAVGIPRDEKRFHPHITLARIKRPSDVSQSFIKKFISAPVSTDIVFNVPEIILFRSILSPSGARYKPLFRWKVCGKQEYDRGFSPVTVP